MKQIVSRVATSTFVRNVRSLATGSVLAQSLGIVSAPLITRLYEPNEYACLALFLTILGTMVPAAAGRYDAAIVVARRESDVEPLFALSVLVAIAVTAVVLVAWLIAGNTFVTILKAEPLGCWWWSIPPLMLISAITTSLRFMANRHEHYKLISRVAVMQTAITIAATIFCGAWWRRSDGQLVGATIGLLSGLFMFVPAYSNELRRLPAQVGRSLFTTARRYSDFPLYGAGPTLIDSVTLGIPVLMLTKYFSEAELGHYALGVKVFSAPLTFVAVSVSQVHVRTVANLVAMRPNDLPKYTHTLALCLLAIACVPATVIVIGGEYLFNAVFGPSWGKAGTYLAILTPALVIKFVTSAVSGVFGATGHLKLVAVWKILSMAVTAGGLAYASAFGNMILFLRSLAILDVLLYGCLYVTITYAVNHIKLEQPQRTART